jgi:hypothetical protein
LQTEAARLADDSTDDPRVIREKRSGAVRSVFQVHRTSPLIAALVRNPVVLDRARQILGSEVYIHQSRINFMPGFTGQGFYWHSDFETWHAEDGLPAPRAVSMSLALSTNFPYNGGLMVIPGSHRTSCTAPAATSRRSRAPTSSWCSTASTTHLSSRSPPRHADRTTWQNRTSPPSTTIAVDPRATVSPLRTRARRHGGSPPPPR